MDPDAALAALAVEGERLIRAADGAWDAPVPGLDWTVRDVVVHTGAVHRWSADVVRRRLGHNETGGSSAFHPAPPGLADDDGLVAWYAEGLAALVDVLTDASDDLDCWTFAPGTPARSFWCRRQVHETAIHRVDVESAAGLPVTPCAPDLAQDGLAEIAGFAGEPAFAVGEPGRLALRADDGPDWLITLGGERIAMAPADARTDARTDAADVADAAVAGSSSDLYRWTWNRPAPVTVTGDPEVAALWRRVRIT